jgi:hypothetical protein
LTGTASAEVVKYKATLNGQQQTTPVKTTASGSAELEFDTDTKVLKGKVKFQGLTPTGGHIHEAACGADGPVRFDFASLTSPIEIEQELDAEEEAALTAGEYYINFHTDAYPNGEIRGQILRSGSDETCPAKGGGGDDGGGGKDSGAGKGSGDDQSPSDAGASSSSGGASPSQTDDGGCSATGSAPGSGLAVALGFGMAVAAMKRRRKH